MLTGAHSNESSHSFRYDRQLQDPNCQGSTLAVTATDSGGGDVSGSGALTTLLFSGDDSRDSRTNMTVKTAVNVTEWPPQFTESKMISSGSTNNGTGYSALFAGGAGGGRARGKSNAGGGGGVGLLWESGADGCVGASCEIKLSWV